MNLWNGVKTFHKKWGLDVNRYEESSVQILRFLKGFNTSKKVLKYSLAIAVIFCSEKFVRIAEVAVHNTYAHFLN